MLFAEISSLSESDIASRLMQLATEPETSGGLRAMSV
jgi:hypothetical protein